MDSIVKEPAQHPARPAGAARRVEGRVRGAGPLAALAFLADRRIHDSVVTPRLAVGWL